MKVDAAAEEVFKRLNMRDKYMVARRGYLSGANHAAVLMGRMTDVDNYHNHPNQLARDIRMNLTRYCSEFEREEAARTLRKSV